MHASMHVVHVMHKWNCGGGWGGGGWGWGCCSLSNLHSFLANLVTLQLNSYVDSHPKSFVEPILGPLCVGRRSLAGS